MSPLISVVIVNYNYRRFLAQAIDSALAQTHPQVEVIVVDDGSNDGSLALLESYGARIRWFEHQQLGVSAARNRGIAECGGAFVAFMDADDYWRPDKLAKQLQQFDDARVGMVYCGLQYVDESGKPLSTNTEGRFGEVLVDLALMTAPGVPVGGSAAVVRRECFHRVGEFDRELSTSADWDMWRRLACHYLIRIVPEPLACYRQHGAAMHRNVELFEHDMLHAFADMFSDPSAAAIHQLRRRCYGALFRTLAGSFWRVARWDKCLHYAVRSVLAWPPEIAYLTHYPLRQLRHRLRSTARSAG